MTAPAITNRRRPHWHAPEKGTGPAFALSLFAHALLFLSIAFVVRWKTEPVGTVSAELWGGFPAARARAGAGAGASAGAGRRTAAAPTGEGGAGTRAARKADIVLEQKKKPEPPKKVEVAEKDRATEATEEDRTAEARSGRRRTRAKPKPRRRRAKAEARRRDADKRRSRKYSG